MKTILFSVALSLLLSGGLRAAPITYEEISLLVRMHESDAYLTQQIAQRRLVRGLTPEQESALKTQGLSAAAFQALRHPAAVLSEAEAAAFERQRLENKRRIFDEITAAKAREDEKFLLAARAREEEAQTPPPTSPNEPKAPATPRSLQQAPIDGALQADYFGPYPTPDIGRAFHPEFPHKPGVPGQRAQQIGNGSQDAKADPVQRNAAAWVRSTGAASQKMGSAPVPPGGGLPPGIGSLNSGARGSR